MSDKVLKIASLTCSFNRREKTAAFLKSMLAQPLPEGYALDIYLLDDKSSDGTADFVRTNFPTVRVLDGTGSLFWAGGMRKIWNYALEQADYDFFLLMNDDVVLAETALARLIDAHHQSGYPASVILGTTMDMKSEIISYGGYKRTNKINSNVVLVTPDENELKECEIGNANIMLIDKNTVARIGTLSTRYTHGFADFDYTLRAVKKGVKVLVAPGYFGNCDDDHGKHWLSADVPFKKRLKYLYSPTGLAYNEYLAYTWKHFPYTYPGKFFKLWFKTLFPIFYDRFKKTNY